MESFLDVQFQSFVFRVQIFHPNEVMEEANIFTDFSLKPITSNLGKSLSATGSSGRGAAAFGRGATSDQMAAKQTCDNLLEEDMAILSALNPHHKDSVQHLRSLWWGPQVAALLHSLALKHTAFAGGWLRRPWRGEGLGGSIFEPGLSILADETLQDALVAPDIPSCLPEWCPCGSLCILLKVCVPHTMYERRGGAPGGPVAQQAAGSGRSALC